MKKEKPEGADEIAFHSLISVCQHHQKPLYLSDLRQSFRGLKFKTTMEALDNLLKKKLITIDHEGINLTKFN